MEPDSGRSTVQERDEARTANRGGVSFLCAHGVASLVAGALTFALPVETAALIFMFQGMVAFPASLLLERALGYRMVGGDNSLQPLFIQVASIQLLALPAVIVVYSLEPLYTPVAFAAVGGAHFLPYTWLQRTRIYAVLAAVVAIAPYLLLLLGLGSETVYHATGFVIGSALLVAAVGVLATVPGPGRRHPDLAPRPQPR